MNKQTSPFHRRAFALIDLAMLLAILALVLAILLPAVAFARGAGGSATSMNNLRTLGAAHYVYAVDWDDRQLTYIVDDAATYGNIRDWWVQYNEDQGSDGSWGHPANHPDLRLGWGRGFGRVLNYMYEPVQSANASLLTPIVFGGSGLSTDYYGAFRIPNAAQFHQYLNGRFYDRTFYAPADTAPIDSIGDIFERPDQYSNEADLTSSVGDVPAWSSYCLSPAAMFHPDVMRRDDPNDPNANGWVDPFALPNGLASPSVSQVVYPALKTRMLEHHWLQNAPVDNCNPGFDPGTFSGCEPYYFNHGMSSAPNTLFFDGHVEAVPVARAIADDLAVRQVTQSYGLWSRDTVWGEDGYLSEYAYDTTQTSFHVLTTDGVEGRDVLSPGATSSWQRPVAPRDRVKRAAPPRRGKTTGTRVSFDGD